MKPSSTKMARLFGLIMIVLVGAWDIDAMRPHIAAHSWYTLALVALFLVAHVGDYLTVGRILHRFDPLIFARAEESTSPAAAFSEIFSFRHAFQAAWQRTFAYQQPPTLLLRPASAKLYTFTITEAASAQAVGAPAVVSSHYSVVPVEQASA
jgi:hypothetical protein